jgi:hypothetical protein
MNDTDARAFARDHDRLREMVMLAAERDAVWAEIGGFDRIAGWHPLIERVEPTEIEGETYRHLITTEGERFLERLIETGPHHVTYEVIDGPLPATDHRATLSCVAEKDGGCHVFWGATFVPFADAGHVADEIVARFYRIGLAALGERFG